MRRLRSRSPVGRHGDRGRWQVALEGMDDFGYSASRVADRPRARPRPGRVPAMKRFPVLDGLRGASALYVVLHPAHEEVRALAPAAWLVRGCPWLEFAHYGVAVFIVLSGFSLAPGAPFGGGFWASVARRARRIL